MIINKWKGILDNLCLHSSAILPLNIYWNNLILCDGWFRACWEVITPKNQPSVMLRPPLDTNLGLRNFKNFRKIYVSETLKLL